MQLTIEQRLMLSNQYLILEALYPKESDWYKRQRTAIENGYTRDYENALVAIDPQELAEDECRFVARAITMYQVLGETFDDTADKSQFPHGRPLFPGFDGNNETQLLGYATYLIDNPGHYDSMKRSHGYNSHCPMASTYETMLMRLEDAKNKYRLTVAEALEILGR